MTELLVQGLTIAALGMGFVFLFLTLQVACTTAMSLLTNRFFPPAAPALHPHSHATVSAPAHHGLDPALIAAITTAIKLHRNKN
jgi:oxaloacetate decarboxylase gamma subunit